MPFFIVVSDIAALTAVQPAPQRKTREPTLPPSPQHPPWSSQVPYSKKTRLHGSLSVGGAERNSGQEQVECQHV